MYLLLAFAAMVALHFGLPGLQWLAGPWTAIGLLPLFAGLVIAILADREFKRQGTTVRPFEPASALVTGGPFRFSRNPIYLGMVLALAGVAIGFGSLTPLVIPPLFLWLISRRFIAFEERALEDQFGQQYRDYKSRVPRWL